MGNQNFKKNFKIFEKFFFLEHVSGYFRALSVVKVSARSDLPLSISGKVQKEGGGGGDP